MKNQVDILEYNVPLLNLELMARTNRILVTIQDRINK